MPNSSAPPEPAKPARKFTRLVDGGRFEQLRPLGLVARCDPLVEIVRRHRGTMAGTADGCDRFPSPLDDVAIVHPCARKSLLTIRQCYEPWMLRFGSLGETRARSLLDEQARELLTYPEVGGTRLTELPSGYTHDRYSVPLGGGVFERAKRGIREWRAHTGAGVEVFPSGAPIDPDTNVVLGIRFGRLHAIAACRIVYVCDEANRFGFAYGTLPEHPERGEESFIIEQDAAGEVRFTITAFSRPASAITRLARPFARVIQQRATHQYLEALRTYVLRPD